MRLGFTGLVGWLFVLIAAPMFLFTGYGLAWTAYLALFGEHTVGAVAGTVSRGSAQGMATSARVRFLDRDGHEHWVEGDIFFRNRATREALKSHDNAAQVRVLYPDGEPEDALLADGKTIAWRVFLLLFFAAPIGLGVWLIRSDPEGWDEGWEPE